MGFCKIEISGFSVNPFLESLQKNSGFPIGFPTSQPLQFQSLTIPLYNEHAGHKSFLPFSCQSLFPSLHLYTGQPKRITVLPGKH